MKRNKETYKEKYTSGYGLQYPDGHFIRVVTQILEYQEKMSECTVLDYGCGNGIHMEFLESRWPKSIFYGLDISDIAIKQAKNRLPEWAENFKQCEPVPNIKSLFGEVKFDLVVANQVLYYLDDPDLDNVLNQIYQALNPGGIIFISWMGVENFYFDLSRPIEGKSLRKIELNNRLKETSEINIKSKEEFSSLFKKYQKLHLGYYDTIIREDEGSTMHYFIVAKKQ